MADRLRAFSPPPTRWGKAIHYLQQAGENASRRSASVEAISHFTKGLTLLESLSDTPEHARQELTLQVALGPLLGMTKGFAAPEVKKTYDRVRELCQQEVETSQLFAALTGLERFYLLQTDLRTSRELGLQCLRLAQRIQDPAFLLEAHRGVGGEFLHTGELVLAREHLEQGFALYNSQQHRSLIFRYGNDPGAACLSFAAEALWLLGYPDRALQRSREALTLAHELAHPYSLAFNLVLAAKVHLFRREHQATYEKAERAITLSREQGFAFTSARGLVLRGWALTEQGQAEEGIVQIRQGITAQQARGIRLERPGDLSLLAEAYGKMGQAEKGLAALAEALAAVDNTEERYYEAELYRLKGELTLQSQTSGGQVSEKSRVRQNKSKVSNPQHPAPSPQAEMEAEACFLKAIEIARKQQAKSWELRAVMSLARLWRQQGKRDEARQMLAEIYNWFTEGFDTADLKEAEALLQRLT